MSLGPSQFTAIERYSWPSNVRELQNVIRRAAVLNPDPNLPLTALPLASQPAMQFSPLPVLGQLPETGAVNNAPDSLSVVNALKGLTLDEIERIVIEAAIDNAGGSMPAAARALGVNPSTIYCKRERWSAGQ